MNVVHPFDPISNEFSRILILGGLNMTNGNSRSNTIKIKNVNLTRKIVHQIGKFTVLWNVFEAEKCDNHCNHHMLKKIASSLTNTLNPIILENFAVALQGRVDIPRHSNFEIKMQQMGES
jgi:hypothetical protein